MYVIKTIDANTYIRTRHPCQEMNKSNDLICQSCCAGVFIDLKKAFGTVDHELLVEKLNAQGAYDIRGVANKWLQNYLTNRKQYVVIDDHFSGLLDMTCGVPQGSVLGPIMFIIYMNDM